jgi:uncharacterized protein YjiS (DUF1127 family)
MEQSAKTDRMQNHSGRHAGVSLRGTRSRWLRFCVCPLIAVGRYIRRRTTRARSRAELDTTSDHALRDIGVLRCQIDFFVP